MSISGEQVNTVDNSLEVMHLRLRALQGPLGSLMDKARFLFEDVYPQAPHPSQEPDLPVYGTWSLDYCREESVPKIRELTVVLGASRWVRVFMGTNSLPNAYPRKRLWLWRPHEGQNRKTDFFLTHDPSRKEIPCEVETAEYNDKGMCTGIVGFAYEGQESFIEEARTALVEARDVAEDLGLVVVRG